ARNPASMTARAAYVFGNRGAQFQPADRPRPTGLELIRKQIEANLDGLAVHGDPSGTHYPIGQPLVDPVVGAFVVAGFVGFTLTARRPEHVLVLLWLWVPAIIV